MELLRFITAGSVDDGKSTLIGRLLYDSKNIMRDQLSALEKQSKNGVEGELDLALLTDGLRAEREQGITIDVAYKYFSTPKRKFIIADAPGHIQYTRNMITGASTAGLMVILIDARTGVIEQTKRHTLIASLLSIPVVIVAVNKMDLVGYRQEVFALIVTSYQEMAKDLALSQVTFIPISARDGDNVVDRSQNMDWYTHAPLLEILETVPVNGYWNDGSPRLSVQYVIRPQSDAFPDYRGYAGRVISGMYRVGDLITALPSGLRSTIATIETGGKEVSEAFAPQQVTLQLADDIDVGRGEMLVAGDDFPTLMRELEAFVCWMDTKPFTKAANYLLQINSQRVTCRVTEICYVLDVNTFERQPNPAKVGLNDIFKAIIKTATEVAIDPYEKVRQNGSAILIDPTSNLTVGACILEGSSLRTERR